MFKYNYKGYFKCNSICGVDIKEKDDVFTVVLTELEENNGTSVTNMIEHLATEIKKLFLRDISIENICWIEHYPETKYRKKETFAKVMMEWDGDKFSHPRWKHLKNVPSYWELAQVPDDYSN